MKSQNLKLGIWKSEFKSSEFENSEFENWEVENLQFETSEFYHFNILGGKIWKKGENMYKIR